mgnify:CR=1 FL=1
MPSAYQNHRGARVYRREAPEEPDRITCHICGFRGNSAEVTPGENFPTALVTTGSTYVWTNSNDPLSGLDLTVLPTTNPAVSCGSCGASLLMSGHKGQGQ